MCERERRLFQLLNISADDVHRTKRARIPGSLVQQQQQQCGIFFLLSRTHTHTLTGWLSYFLSLLLFIEINDRLDWSKRKNKDSKLKEGKPFSTAQNWAFLPKTESKQNRNSQERVQTHDSASHYSPLLLLRHLHHHLLSIIQLKKESKNEWSQNGKPIQSNRIKEIATADLQSKPAVLIAS